MQFIHRTEMKPADCARLLDSLPPHSIKVVIKFDLGEAKHIRCSSTLPAEAPLAAAGSISLSLLRVRVPQGREKLCLVKREKDVL